MTDPQYDERMERSLRAWLGEHRPPPVDRDAQIGSVLDRLQETPQARRRSLGRWFERGEGVRRRPTEHDHPPETHRRNRLMFSATGLIAAFAILAIGVSVIDTTPAPPSVGSGATHVAAADGSGDFDTIGAAVDAATDGDTILVRPGTYTEAIVIDKDITLQGDGPVEEIVITAPEDGPTAPLWEGTFNAEDPYAVRVVAPGATLHGLTFEGMHSEVFLDGGSPTLSESVFIEVGWAYDGSNNTPNGSSIVVTGGGSPTVTENSIRDGGPIGVFGDSDPKLVGNVLSGGPHIYLADYGAETLVEGNSIEGTKMWAIGAFDRDRNGWVTIENNTLSDPGYHGVNLSAGSADIIDNEIDGARVSGIALGLQPANVTGNTLIDNRLAISATFGDKSVSGNMVRGGLAGIVLSGDSDVRDNEIEGVQNRGLVISGGSPVLRDNRSCGNGENLFVADSATPDIDGSNVICEDAPAE